MCPVRTVSDCGHMAQDHQDRNHPIDEDTR